VLIVYLKKKSVNVCAVDYTNVYFKKSISEKILRESIYTIAKDLFLSLVICSNNFFFIHVKFFVHIFNLLFSLLFILSISKFCNAKNDILFSSKMNTLLKIAKKISSILIGIKKYGISFRNCD